MEEAVRRVASLVFTPLVGLVALVVATAAAAVASYYSDLIIVPGPVPALYRLDSVTIVASTAATAGAVFAWFLQSAWWPRIALAFLGAASLAMLVLEGSVLSATDQTSLLAPGLLIPGAHDQTPSGFLPWQLIWARDAVPTAAGAVLAVAVIVLAATRRPPVLYITPYTPAPRGPSVPGGALALIAGAVVWFATGLGQVALMLAHGQEPLDWFGRRVNAGYLDFGSSTVLYLTGAVSIVVAGVLYRLLLARRLHWFVPLIIGIGFVGVTIWSIVDAFGRIDAGTGAGGGYPYPQLLAAAELAVQVPAAGPGAVLAVPLIIAGVRRRLRPTPAPQVLSPAETTDLYATEPTLTLF
jgi:hypothetical protein